MIVFLQTVGCCCYPVRKQAGGIANPDSILHLNTGNPSKLPKGEKNASNPSPNLKPNSAITNKGNSKCRNFNTNLKNILKLYISY